MLGNIKTEGGIILSKVKNSIVILHYEKQKELLKDGPILDRQSCGLRNEMKSLLIL